MPSEPVAPGEAPSRVLRGIRLDLLIAVCALLISSFASAASWWQARLLGEQTRVLQEQLGAQVWPYVGVAETLTGVTMAIKVQNDGLGPAVLRSETALVDGKPKASIVAVLHAVVGPNLMGRLPHGEKLALGLDSDSPGAVLRPGESTQLLTLSNAHYSQAFLRAYRRVTFRVCYCSIIPGQCWLSDSGKSSDPAPLTSCAEIPNDLMHSSSIDALSSKF